MANSITANNNNATYQWLDCNNNDAIIIGAKGQTYAASANGSYRVELTENGCIDTSSCVDIVTVGIHLNSLENKPKIFPTPTKGSFNVDLGYDYHHAEITISDINGKQLFSQSFLQNEAISINLNEQKGIYLLSIKADNQQAVIRLIKE